EISDFARHLHQFSAWFDGHHSAMPMLPMELDEDARNELKVCAEKLKNTYSAVEEVLARVNAIKIAPAVSDD
ncbi:MAG TPA: hypothetical protein V6D23_26270, partial [Candidatus Obscuribacterales bacterium]